MHAWELSRISLLTQSIVSNPLDSGTGNFNGLAFLPQLSRWPTAVDQAAMTTPCPSFCREGSFPFHYYIDACGLLSNRAKITPSRKMGSSPRRLELSLHLSHPCSMSYKCLHWTTLFVSDLRSLLTFIRAVAPLFILCFCLSKTSHSF